MSAAAPVGQHPEDTLWALPRTLARGDIVGIAGYVALSLLSALASSIAALMLVPLVQPASRPGFGGRLLVLPTGTDGLVLFFVGASVIFALARWLASRLAARLSSGYGVKLRREMHASLLGAPMASLSGASSAEIANVLTNSVELIKQGFAALLQLLVAGTTTLVSLAFALWVSPVLTLALPVLVGFGLVTSRLSSGEQSRISRRYIEDMTRLFWMSEDFPRRVRHVRSFERENAEKAAYEEVASRLGQGYRRQMDIVAAGRLLLELLAAAGVATVFLIAHRLRGVDSSSLIAVGLLMGRLLPFVGTTRQSFHQLRLAAPALELWQRYCGLDVECKASATAVSPYREDKTLHIVRIRLSLPSIGLDISGLDLRPGEMTLVYGDSGIGKSSLVDVLAGMIAPDEFVAQLGGQSIDFGAYRQLVRKGAYVSQNVRPWQHTVRECLLWAAPDATEQQLRGALRDVGFDPLGADTPEALELALQRAPDRLSGGELQRLLLAQVILRAPVLALLDESTGALDAASELAVLASLKHRLPDTILITVSHRPGVAQIADQCLNIIAGSRVTVQRTICRPLDAVRTG